MSNPGHYADITPADSTMTFAEALSEPDFMKLAIPSVNEGDPCVDFDLPIYDFATGSRVQTDSSFHLQARAASQPVALIFGSYT